MCTCTRSKKKKKKKNCLIENFPEWKTDLQFHYDTIITLRILHRDITLKHRKISLIHPLYISPPRILIQVIHDIDSCDLQ